jgi:hypothetical protein
MPWLWVLAFEHYADRSLTYGYAVTREGAMAAFAKSWRRRRPTWQPANDGPGHQSPLAKACTSLKTIGGNALCKERSGDAARIMIYGPKNDGTASETRVIRHFQECMPYGLFVPNVDASGA